MAQDQQGLPVTGTASSAAALDRAVTEYYAWTGDPLATLQAAADADPGFALGHSGTASLLLLNGVRGDAPAVASALAAAERAAGGATSRERRHSLAARAWAEGRLVGATAIWEDILLDHPTDALALRFAHDTYFYLAHSQSIRDSLARVLPFWDESNPNYGYLLGQYAFGLEEMGDLAQAESVGREAIARNGRDVWAVHAVAHVLETQSRQEEGIAFLQSSRPEWTRASGLAVHNFWHLALYLIEQDRTDEVLAEYDAHVASRLAADSLLDLVDAAALLWRLELAGTEVGGRWAPLAAQWLTHVDDHVLVFNDLHIALAVSRAQDAAGVQHVRQSLDAYVRDGAGDNRDVTVAVGRSLVEAVLAFAEGDWRRAVDLILPVRHKISLIGGSHAQRDLLTQTLIAAAQRAGDRRLARALLAERVALRPTRRTRLAFAEARA